MVMIEHDPVSPASPWPFPVISADSHITEAPNTYIDFIDPAYRDRAPRMVDMGEAVGDVFVIDGMKRPIPMGLVAAAGKPPEEIRVSGVHFAELHRSGWDPQARLADQDRDGVAAEIIYPTVGMQLCNHPDAAYKKASSPWCVAVRTSWACSCSAACSNGTPRCASSAWRPMPAGYPTSCIGWITPRRGEA